MNDLNVNEESFKKTFKSSFDQIQNMKKQLTATMSSRREALENVLNVLEAIYYYSISMCFVMLSQRARWTDVDYFVILSTKRAERKGTSNLRLIEVWSPGLHQDDRPRCCCWTTDHPAMMRSLVLSTSVDIIISGSTHQQVGSNYYYKYTCGRDAELLLAMPS